VDNDGTLDKESTSYNDIFLMLLGWHSSFIVMKTVGQQKILTCRLDYFNANKLMTPTGFSLKDT
jgi:hypothetical protein